MANRTPLQIKKSRFRDNFRRLLTERGWTQAYTSRISGVPLRWIERAYGTGLARQQKRNTPHLIALMQAFGFKTTDPEVLWQKDMVIPTDEPVPPNSELHQAIEYLRLIFANGLPALKHRIYKLLHDGAVGRKTSTRRNRSYKGKKQSANTSGTGTSSTGHKDAQDEWVEELDRRQKAKRRQVELPETDQDDKAVEALALRKRRIADLVEEGWPRAFLNTHSTKMVWQMIDDQANDSGTEELAALAIIKKLEKRG